MGLINRGGRPYQRAVIDLVHDPDLMLYDQFYAACSGLRYSDTVVLSRSLGMSERTIRNWQAGRTFPPKFSVAIVVINWVKNGKPRELVPQTKVSASVM